jgi:hypothetical protein
VDHVEKVYIKKNEMKRKRKRRRKEIERRKERNKKKNIKIIVYEPYICIYINNRKWCKKGKASRSWSNP